MRRSPVPTHAAPAALLAVALAACATSGDQRGAREPVSITTGSGQRIEVVMNRDDPSVSGEVAAPADRAWDALVTVYTALDAPVDSYNDAERRIGASTWQPQRIAGERMSEWVSCGSGMTGRNADTHRVTLSVTSVVEPEGTGSRITTRIDGTARSMSGASTAPIRCASKGTLESLIVKAVRELAADSAGTAGPST